MNISYKWLKEYVDCDLSVEKVAEVLTSIGLEVGGVEEVQSIKGGLEGLYVGKVLTCELHPNSDHLHVTTVDFGREKPSQIVCGASNIAVDQKVIVADLGCKLYDGDKEFVIKKTKLRGIESYGMICAEDEIGIGSSHDGIIVLPDDAQIGQKAADYYNLDSDYVLEVDITANRADALSHYGVARDLYAWLKQNGYKASLHRPSVDMFKVDNENLPIEVTIQNNEACRRYSCISITDCEVKESPDWLKNKLQVVGLRPINNIVDITNYIMIAYGQPMHCFDADMVEGKHIIVGTVKSDNGEYFTTLDGEKHELGEYDLVISNDVEPMCIAGVFGGKGSGTYSTTRNVVLESANFHPTWIRKSSRRYGLSTDSSYRFERGVDPEGTIYALKQAAILCRELAGGKVSMQINDVYPQPILPAKVSLTYEYINNLIGKEIGNEVIKSILDSLEMKIISETDTLLELEVPAYRVDVQRPCDVVEDILRIYGYNNVEIPSQLKSTISTPADTDRSHQLLTIIGEQLIGSGFNEILNNSLTKSSYYEDLIKYNIGKSVKIINALSSDLSVMRQSLLFGGLESISRNTNRQRGNLRFFEIGNCYHYDESKKNEENPIKAYSENMHIALWITGKRVEGSWIVPDEDSSFYELKSYLDNIFTRLGVPKGLIVSIPTDNDLFASGLTFRSRTNKDIAEIGIVSAKQLKNFGLSKKVYYADINWTNLFNIVNNLKVSVKPISKYPMVSRDLALLLDKKVEFGDIVNLAYKTENKLLRRVVLFDVYEGEKLPEGKKSYAVNFILQDENSTLTDMKIDVIMKKLINNLISKLGAELR